MKYMHMVSLFLVVAAYGALSADGIPVTDTTEIVNFEREIFLACLKSCHAGKCTETPDRCPCSKPKPRPRAGEMLVEDEALSALDAEEKGVMSTDAEGTERGEEFRDEVDGQVRRKNIERPDRCPCSKPQPRPVQKPNNRPNQRPQYQRPQQRPQKQSAQRPRINSFQRASSNLRPRVGLSAAERLQKKSHETASVASKD